MDSLPALALYISDLEDRLAEALNVLANFQLDKTTVAPDRPRGGMVRYADGTYWNPGGGRGIYWYDDVSAAWVKL